jgi:hypothetical protein
VAQNILTSKPVSVSILWSYSKLTQLVRHAIKARRWNKRRPSAEAKRVNLEGLNAKEAAMKKTKAAHSSKL